MSILVVLKEIIEFTDKNNNGMYDANIDGKPIQIIYTDCLTWSKPKEKLMLNKTVAFSGETSSFFTSSKNLKKKNAPFPQCSLPTMPNNIPDGMLSFKIETSNLPVIPGSPTNVYDTTPTKPMMVTQNGMRVTMRVKGFPFKNRPNTTIVGGRPSKSRLAFRFHVLCDDYNSDFKLYEQRRLSSRRNPSNLDNGYFEWQPNARVKFDGSNEMFEGKYKEQPIRLARSEAKQAGLPGESTRDGFIPKVPLMTDIPYSAVMKKMRLAYQDTYIEDVVLSIGGKKRREEL